MVLLPSVTKSLIAQPPPPPHLPQAQVITPSVPIKQEVPEARLESNHPSYMVNIETLPHCPSLYVFEILFSDGEYFKLDVIV